MPLFPFDAMPAMLDGAEGADVIIPDVDGKIYPCAAVYRRKDYGVYESLYREGNFRMTEALKRLNTQPIPYEVFAPYDTYGCAFTNINTRADLDQVERMMSL